MSVERQHGSKTTHGEAGPRALAQAFIAEFPGNPKTAERMFSRLFAGQERVTLDVADRLCIFLGASLDEVYGPCEGAS